MAAVVGPVVSRAGGYAFDSWSPETGLSQGFCYRRVEDAHYARRSELRSAGRVVVCATLEQFAAAIGLRRNPLAAAAAAC